MTELDKNDLIPRSELRAEVERAVAAALSPYAPWLPRIPKMWISLYGDEETGQLGLVALIGKIHDKIDALTSRSDRMYGEFEEMKQSQEDFSKIKELLYKILYWVQILSMVVGIAAGLGLFNSSVLSAVGNWLYKAYLENIVISLGAIAGGNGMTPIVWDGPTITTLVLSLIIGAVLILALLWVLRRKVK